MNQEIKLSLETFNEGASWDRSVKIVGLLTKMVDPNPRPVVLKLFTMSTTLEMIWLSKYHRN